MFVYNLCFTLLVFVLSKINIGDLISFESCRGAGGRGVSQHGHILVKVVVTNIMCVLCMYITLSWCHALPVRAPCV